MNRLTTRNKDGFAMKNPDTECSYAVFIDRLASYEDTGLTPKRIKQLIKDAGKVCEKCTGCDEDWDKCPLEKWQKVINK